MDFFDDEKKQYLTDLPTPPSTPSEYNEDEGEVLINFDKHCENGELVTFVHNLEVLSSSEKQLTCFMEINADPRNEGNVLLACVPPDADLSPGGKLPYHIALSHRRTYRLCICPKSKLLVVSHPAEDIKIATTILPEARSWVLAVQAEGGYLRLFDFEQTHRSHMDFPVACPPLSS